MAHLLSDEAVSNLTDLILSRTPKETLTDFIFDNKYTKYHDNPVGFCEEVLGDILTDDVKRMMESVRDNVVTIAISANATGKSHGAGRISTWFYCCHEKVKVFTAAAPPIDNLKNILWGEIGTIYEKYPDLFSRDIKTFLDIRRGPEDFFIGVAIPSSSTDKEARFSGKHRPFMLFVIDEGDAVPDEVYKGIESCMSGGHVRLLIMFNPRKSSGAVYRMIQNKEANIVHLSAFDHPNVRTGENVINGAVTRDVTVDRINRWSRPFRSGDTDSPRSTYTLPDFLVGAVAPKKDGNTWPPLEPGKYKITDPALSYMTLGQYPAQGSNQLISEEWISRARSRYDIYVAQHGCCAPKGTKGVMGLDVAEMGDDRNVAVARYGGYLTPFDTWSGVDTVKTGDRAIKWYHNHLGIDRANVDANGYGAGVAPYMQKFGEGVVATGIKVTWKPTTSTELGDFKILRDELLWRVREWLRTDSGAMLPPDIELDEELRCPTYDTETGYVRVMRTDKMKEELGRSPDKLMALALTFAGAGGFFDNCQFLAFPE